MGVIMIRNNFSECEGVLLLTGTGCASEPEWLLSPSRPIRARCSASVTNHSPAWLTPATRASAGDEGKNKSRLRAGAGLSRLSLAHRGYTGRHYAPGPREVVTTICCVCQSRSDVLTRLMCGGSFHAGQGLLGSKSIDYRSSRSPFVYIIFQADK